MNPFNIETWATFENGLAICFRTPTMEEYQWASDAAAQFRGGVAGDAEERALIKKELPGKLASLAVNAKLPGGAALPPDWVEQLSSLSILTGGDGLKIMEQVFFRSRLKLDKEDPSGPEG